MDNILFERDYRETPEERVRRDQEDEAIIKAMADSILFRIYRAYTNILPKIVVLKDKQTYERLLKKCDALAKERYGKVRGIVDYQQFDSSIQLLLPFWEVDFKEERELLEDILENAHGLCFEVTEDGWLSVKIRINYFDEINPDMGQQVEYMEKALDMEGIPHKDLTSEEAALLVETILGTEEEDT